jgi:hypothetical protein
VIAGWRKQHEQDRHEHQHADRERLVEDAADRGEPRAHFVEPRRLPSDGERAAVEDDFLNLAHCAPRIGAFAPRANLRLAFEEKDNTDSDFRKEFWRAWREAPGFPSVFSARPGARRAIGGAPMALTRIARRRLVSTVDLLQ